MPEETAPSLLPGGDELPPMQAHHIDATAGQVDVGEGMIFGQESPTARNKAHAAASRDPNDSSTWGKVGRNNSCSGGSGKKYKHCHGGPSLNSLACRFRRSLFQDGRDGATDEFNQGFVH